MSLTAALKVLLVGHSLIGPVQPALLEQLMQSREPAAEVVAQVINGAPLGWNWEHGAEAQGVDARATLAAGGIDTLILTEALPLANHLEWSDSGAFAARYADAARQVNPEAQVFVLETWHSRSSGTGIAVEGDAGADVPWRDRLDTDLALWQGLVDDANARVQGGAPLGLIPAGQGMARLADAVAQGGVPGLRDLGPLFDDDIHPSVLGHYFVALVTYAAITGADPVGLPHAMRDPWGTPLPAPSPDLAVALQKIARDTVEDFTGQTLARATPKAQPAPQDSPEPDGIALNLAPVADWGTQLPFLDLMKTARPWIGHLPGKWGGMEFEALQGGGHLDAQGWPLAIPRSLSSIGTLILTDLPEDSGGVAGRYRLRFKGKGIVEAMGRASAVRYGKGEVTFDVTPGKSGVEIRIQRSDPSDPVREITVVRQDRAAAFDAGARFNPDWLALLKGVRALRFMDWMETNNSTLSAWDDRPKPDDFTWARHGVPLEVMLALANETATDPWFTLPHLADDGFVTAFAETVRDGLDPGRRVYVEFSNEVWNWQFAQTAWADAQAKLRWGVKDAGTQFHGMRAAEVARLVSLVLPRDRLVNVIATHTGWLGLEDAILSAPLFTAENPGNPPPVAAFDAYAVTGYFAGTLGLESRAELVAGWLAEGGGDAMALAAQEARDGSVSGDPEHSLADLLTRILPYHAEVARRHGLDLLMYEGGSHATGVGPMVEDPALTEFLIAFNYSPEMGALYGEAIAGWRRLGGRLFNAYNDVSSPGKWGSWGARRHLGDDNPRWDALEAAK